MKKIAIVWESLSIQAHTYRHMVLPETNTSYTEPRYGCFRTDLPFVRAPSTYLEHVDPNLSQVSVLQGKADPRPLGEAHVPVVQVGHVRPAAFRWRSQHAERRGHTIKKTQAVGEGSFSSVACPNELVVDHAPISWPGTGTEPTFHEEHVMRG